MAKTTGKVCKVALGSTKVLAIGSWDVPGITTDLLESTELGDEWKTSLPGLKDGGEISFSGFFDKADSTGQKVLRDANLYGSALTDVRFYVDSVSYFVPTTTNPASSVYITKWGVKADKGSLVEASFTAKISGAIELL
jgi:hypothetical protein